MTRLLFICLLFCVNLNLFAQKKGRSKNKIQLAILVDVSGSMDALIEQTSSRIWRIANYLNTGTKKGEKATVEIALITYGDVFVDSDSTYTRVRSYFTTEIDSVASQLVTLEALGSVEYCWAAIDVALDRLHWSRKKGDLRMIVISGNESFDQGAFDPDKVLSKAKKRDVVINTIYCAERDDSVSVSWQSAATRANGTYFKLSFADSVLQEPTFLDHALIGFNNKLNLTYLPYGPSGQNGFKRMIRQDEAAELLGIEYLRDRIFFKATQAYRNTLWDLVDAFEKDSTVLFQSISNLPDEIVDLPLKQQQEYLHNLMFKRKDYRDAINMRYEMISKYVDTRKKTIDKMMIDIAKTAGARKGFSFPEK